MYLSIVVVSYNTLSVTRDCLQSIRDSRLQLTHEVIVVDNDSRDGSVEMIESEFPESLLIRNSVNCRFARANNQAMALAAGDYALLLNSDTIVTPGNIEELVEFVGANQPRVGCAGPRVLNLNGSLQSEGRPMLFGPRGALLRQLKAHHWGGYLPFLQSLLPPGLVINGHTRKVGFVSGCCMLLPRSVYLEVGGFDEAKYHFYGEEVGLCRKLHQAGFETWVHPESQITHLGGASTGEGDLARFQSKTAERFLSAVTGRGGAAQGLLTCSINICGSLFWSAAYRGLGRRKKSANNWRSVASEIDRARGLLPVLLRGRTTPEVHSEAEEEP